MQNEKTMKTRDEEETLWVISKQQEKENNSNGRGEKEGENIDKKKRIG